MRRRILALALAATLGTVGWLAGSESGLQAVARLAMGASGGRLQIEAVGGRLVGPFALGQLRWQSPGLDIALTQVRIDWSPTSLVQGTLNISELHVERLQIVSQPTGGPLRPPADLRLPLAVDAENVAISQIAWSDTMVAGDLAGRFVSDGRHHRLDGLRAQLAGVELSGGAVLDGAAPFALDARLQVAGRIAQHPLALTLTASGPLERLALTAIATEGLAGQARATLTPFATQPFADARLQLDGIDPAAWLPGAPQARLSATADFAPQDRGLVGSFALTNHQPGPLDRQRLPVTTLAGALDWQGDRLRLSALHAALAGGGELSGDGDWRDGQLGLTLRGRRLDAAQFATVLRSTRLDGPISLTASRDRQAIDATLQDANFRLLASAVLSGNKFSLERGELAAGETRLLAQGEVTLDDVRRFAVEGELRQFDPARFARVPQAQINGRFKANGRLAPQPEGEGSFVLRDSRVAGLPFAGEGRLTVAWPRIPHVELRLAAGPNRLDVRGAYGRPDDLLRAEIDAPHLAPYGLDGSLSGEIELAGGLQQPRLTGRLNAPRLGWPDGTRLSGLSLKAEAGREPASPLHVELAIGAFDGAGQPALLRMVQLRADGSNQAHRISLSGEATGRHRLSLAAEGGIVGSEWQGALREARLDAPDPARNVRLVDAAPLRLGSAGWQIGPARLAGDPLDWRLTVQAGADARQLRLALNGHGSRVGQVDGELGAAMRSPWALDAAGRWQGRLNLETGDLSWLGDVIGDGWQSSGRLRAHLQLAGTPERPLLGGALDGRQLGLRLPAQGLELVRGELDAELRDSRLLIRRLGFDSVLQPLPRPLRAEFGDALGSLAGQPGRLDLSGEIRVDRGFGEDSAALDIRLDRFGIFQLPDQWLAVSGSGRLNWQGDTLEAQGRLTVDAGYWQLAPVGTPRLSDDVVIRRKGAEAPAASLRPKLDLDVVTRLGRQFLFRGAGLSNRLAGEVRISARGRDLPRANGTIHAQDGRFEAYGQRLDIERGILSFNGLLDNPALDVRAVRRGLPVTPGVHLAGTAQKPRIRLISDPELPETEKLAWLVLGHGSEQMGAGDASLLLSAASGLLGNESGGVVQQLTRTFGIDEFGVRQGRLGDSGARLQGSRIAGGSTIDTTAAAGHVLSVGKRLSSNALISYEQTLGKAESIVKLTVNLTRQIAIVGRAGSDNAIDVFYTPKRESAKADEAARQSPP